MKCFTSKIGSSTPLFVLVCLLVCVQLSSISLLTAQSVPEELNLVKIWLSDETQIEALEEDNQVMARLRQIRGLGFYYLSLLEPGYVWAMVSDLELQLLKEREYELTYVTKGPVLELYKYRNWGPSKTLPNAYHTYDEVVEELNDLHKRFPQITTIESIGQTQQYEHDIYAFKVSDSAHLTEDEARILFCAAIHGDEVIGTEICMALLQEILERYEGGDETIKSYVDQYEIWFIPVINVDGHHIATHINPNWRRNARDVDRDGKLSLDDGIDLNRNFDFNWNCSGSTEWGKYNYRGVFPFSEAESRHLAEFVREQKFLFSITYHSAEEIVYYPWKLRKGELIELAPDDKLLTELATNMAKQINCINEQYSYRPVRNTRYAGYATNYFYSVLGTIDFMVETGRYDHFASEDTLRQIVRSNLPAAYYLLKRAEGPGLTGHVEDAESGEPLEAEIRILEIDNSNITPRTTDKRTGRYFRVLLPGSYSVLAMAVDKKPQIRDIEILHEGWTVLDFRLR